MYLYNKYICIPLVLVGDEMIIANYILRITFPFTLQTDKKAKLEEQMNCKLVSLCSGHEWVLWIIWILDKFFNKLFAAEVFDDGCCANKTCGDEEKPLPTGVVKVFFYFLYNDLSLK